MSLPSFSLFLLFFFFPLLQPSPFEIRFEPPPLSSSPLLRDKLINPPEGGDHRSPSGNPLHGLNISTDLLPRFFSTKKKMSTIFFFFLSLLDRIKWNQGGDSSSRLHFVLRFSDTLPSLRLERLFLIYARALNILLLGLFSRFRNYLERIFFFFI